MEATIGVDVGVRHIAIARLDGNGKFMTYLYEVPKTNRWDELNRLRDLLDTYVNLSDTVWIEEPPLAGMRNVRTVVQLNQTAGALMINPGRSYFVPVAKWKKHVVGKGNATKDEVAEFLKKSFPNLYKQCDGDQNLIDATCIALYGVDMR